VITFSLIKINSRFDNFKKVVKSVDFESVDSRFDNFKKVVKSVWSRFEI